PGGADGEGDRTASALRSSAACPAAQSALLPAGQVKSVASRWGPAALFSTVAKKDSCGYLVPDAGRPVSRPPVVVPPPRPCGGRFFFHEAGRRETLCEKGARCPNVGPTPPAPANDPTCQTAPLLRADAAVAH